MSTPQILGANGQPARTATTDTCPKCGKGKEHRVASGGFGSPYPVCRNCGHEFRGEVWRG